MKPEEKARKEIDRQLDQCGWQVQDYRDINISADLGVAVRESPLATGDADYLLYVDGKAIGVVKARPVGHTPLTGVETQSGKYLAGLPKNVRAYLLPLPFYDLRTNKHFTLKQNQLMRSDLDELVDCYKPGERQKQRQTWSEKNPEGRWRAYDYEELIKRDKVNLDLFWLKDKSLEDSDDLPDPDVLAEEIADDLQTALDQFRAIAEGLRE